MLAPGASYSGIVREDDFAEGELDLDALGRWNDADPASPTFAGVLINRSDVNPIGMNLVPAEPGRPGDGTDRRAAAKHRRRCASNTTCACATTTIGSGTMTPTMCTRPSPTLFQPPALM